MASKKVAKGLPKRYKKREHKIKAYFATVYPRRKIRRILKHNGHAAAKAWADAHAILYIFSEIIKSRG